MAGILDALQEWPVAFLDTETTGLGARDRIVEIAIRTVDPSGETRDWESLVRSPVPIPGDAERIHGISNEMIGAARSWWELEGTVRSLLEGRVVVAHSARFDATMIGKEWGQHPPPCAWLCSLTLAKKILPGLLSYSLGNLLRALGVEPEGPAHRAAGDVAALATLWRILGDRGLGRESLASLISASGTRQFNGMV